MKNKHMFQNYKWLSPKIKRTMAIVKPMLKMLEKEKRKLKILDIGCGDGTVSELLVGLGNQVWGIDKNPDALKEAEKRGLKVFEEDIEESFPFKDEFFDAVWCLRTLEHIYYTEHFLRECHRVLKSKGILVVTAQNMNSFSNRVRILFGLYPLWVAPSENFPWEEDGHPRFADHVRCFTRSTFKEIVERSGFKIEEIRADFICFNFGQYNNPPWSRPLGKIFSSLGETLIIKARKE